MSVLNLVLLHGWAMTPAVWKPVMPALSRAYQLHNLELPPGGHGHDPERYGAMTGPRILDQWSDACLAAAPAGAVWMGWSLGALVAMNAALRAAGAIRALVLVSATPRFLRGEGWDSGIGGDVLRGFLAGVQRGDRRILNRFVLMQAGDADDARALARALAPCVDDRGPPAALEAGLRILEEVDLRPVLPALDMPVRVIHGAGDRVVPAAAGASLAETVPRGDFVCLDTGHAPFITRSDAFSEAVATWN